MQQANYSPASGALYMGRQDTLPNERYFQQVQCFDMNTQSLSSNIDVALIGYCVDEGILRNEGRIGASEGPDTIRQEFSKLASHASIHIADIGNIICIDRKLEESQQAFSGYVDQCHQQDVITIALGGGHDIAWPHYKGFSEHYSSIGIINFDAHFDLRPLHNTLPSSGTPFWQIAQNCQENNRDFHYSCLGIQPQANTRQLYEIADNHGVQFLTADQIHNHSVAWQTVFIDEILLRSSVIYLSICLDVFSQSIAPGVSAPQATGLTFRQVIPLIKYILESRKTIAIDIAELSPPFDRDRMTAKLAAIILSEILTIL